MRSPVPPSSVVRPPRIPPPRIALRAHIIMVVLVVTLAAVVIALGVHRSLIARALDVGLVTAGVMTLYYGHMLYRGLRHDGGKVDWSLKTVAWDNRPKWFDDGTSGADFSGMFTSFDVGDGCFGIIAGIGLAIFLVACLPILIWLGANAAIIAFFLLTVPTYAALRFGFRLALARGQRCQGHLGRALLTAAVHGLLAGICVGGLFLLIDKVI